MPTANLSLALLIPKPFSVSIGEVSIGSSQKLKVQETLARTAVTEHWPTANVFLASYRPAERSAAAGLCVVKQMSQ